MRACLFVRALSTYTAGVMFSKSQFLHTELLLFASLLLMDTLKVKFLLIRLCKFKKMKVMNVNFN